MALCIISISCFLMTFSANVIPGLTEAIRINKMLKNMK